MDSREREKLILNHLGLARHIARRMYESRPNVRLIGTIEDVIQIGILGIMQACVSYREGGEDSCSFANYAAYSICHRILRAAWYAGRWAAAQVAAESLPEQDHSDPEIDLDRALATLHPSRRRILILRYGLGGEEPLSNPATAARLGISKERVSQLEHESLDRLRVFLRLPPSRG